MANFVDITIGINYSFVSNNHFRFQKSICMRTLMKKSMYLVFKLKDNILSLHINNTTYKTEEDLSNSLPYNFHGY